MLELTDHAHLRAAQRNLSKEQIEFICQRGERLRKAGAIFYRLRKKDVPKGLRRDDKYAKAIGSTVVVSKEGHSVVTVYRNQKAFKRDRSKKKHSNTKR